MNTALHAPQREPSRCGLPGSALFRKGTTGSSPAAAPASVVDMVGASSSASVDAVDSGVNPDEEGAKRAQVATGAASRLSTARRAMRPRGMPRAGWGGRRLFAPAASAACCAAHLRELLLEERRSGSNVSAICRLISAEIQSPALEVLGAFWKNCRPWGVWPWRSALSCLACAARASASCMRRPVVPRSLRAAAS